MRLWSKFYGKATKVKDFTGREIVKGAYNNRNSEFGWNVDHILPQSRGGKTADYNLIICHISTNDEKADKFPVFNANGKKFEILKVENLVKTYGKGETKINAVDNVSFTVNKGEFVAIVGASGSGKSTLLHLIGGVDRPTSGKVYIDGKDIYSLNNDNLAIFRRRQIGLIYQFYNLIPILNVEENITLPCDLDGTTVDKQRLQDLLKTLGLENRKTHLPNQLSGGQQQRVSIGRAMINNPSIMLADEPTGNLDSKASEEIISLLKLSNKKFNQTVIIITHDLEIAKEAERVITIEDGKIIKDERN